MRIAVIGSRTMALAFRLGGITDVTEVQDGGAIDVEAAREGFRRLTADADVGMVIVSAPVAEAIRKEITRFHEQGHMVPLIVELPDETGEGEDPMARVIRRTVGVDVTR
ncbi:MAG TPA: hypothetical protein EYP43_00215 [Thermoplasmata archaeon]|nr:hypothetical protein [Thermoplasmata archaeon]